MGTSFPGLKQEKVSMFSRFKPGNETMGNGTSSLDMLKHPNGSNQL